MWRNREARCSDQVGFAVNPRRWVVERFCKAEGRNRRLSTDFDNSARAFLYAASIMLEPINHGFRHACALDCAGIVSKRLGSPYRPGRAGVWVKIKNPAAPTVKRETVEEWRK